MSVPFVSICIPTYKNVKFVMRLLGSVIEQTFTDYEVVITDNSPDNSIEELVYSFREKLAIRYYKNDPPNNMADNHNAVTQKAVGKWVKIMHDDDWFASPDSLRKFAEAASATNHRFIFSACNNIYSPSGKEVNELLTGERKIMLEDSPLNLFYLNVIGHPSTTMYRMDEAITYDSRFSWVVDVDFYIRYLQKHPGYNYIPEMLVNIAINYSNESNKYYKNAHVEIPEYLIMLSKFPADLLLKHEYVFHLVWNLVRRFRIRHIKQIKELGYAGSLPDKLDCIIQYQKNIPRFILKQTPWSKRLMKACFKKLRIV